MTGPEHYQEAERLIGGFYDAKDVQLAMVHATLALAAATAVSGNDMHDPDFRAWAAVASEAGK